MQAVQRLFFEQYFTFTVCQELQLPSSGTGPLKDEGEKIWNREVLLHDTFLSATQRIHWKISALQIKHETGGGSPGGKSNAKNCLNITIEQYSFARCFMQIVKGKL